MPMVAPPLICPAAVSGFIMRPLSCTARYLPTRTWPTAVSTSTSTTCAPNQFVTLPSLLISALVLYSTPSSASSPGRGNGQKGQARPGIRRTRIRHRLRVPSVLRLEGLLAVADPLRERVAGERGLVAGFPGHV